jgi:coenzyme F420-dependent glucose-6-phosphate dehydrogenase
MATKRATTRQETRTARPSVELGYKLSSEEFGPRDLVRQAAMAEEAGFTFAMISDHFHPWSDRQGQSPFVWSVLGGIAQATERLRVGTAVTCPTIRMHPAIVAHAAATAAAMMPGRFLLGVGAGENLNEHVLGAKWPPTDVRQEMLEEAVAVIRRLWEGGLQSFRGRYYQVENARLYTLPNEPPPILVAGSGPKAAALAGRIGDGFVTTDPDRELCETFRTSGGGDKPRYVEMTVCWAETEARARKTAHEIWPLSALEGPLFTELALPSHFEAAFKMVTEDKVAQAVICGPDPEPHLEEIRKAARAGYTHVFVHQVGPAQKEFMRFYREEVIPHAGR